MRVVPECDAIRTSSLFFVGDSRIVTYPPSSATTFVFTGSQTLAVSSFIRQRVESKSSIWYFTGHERREHKQRPRVKHK